ncbi:hypothetical protein V8B97DRAFT_870037 [Scleroderma yunnanense]
MFHFSTDRLAGLDNNMILKIAPPSKLPSVIPNNAPINYKPHRKVKKIIKHKPQGAIRVPLGDKTNSNCIPINVLSQEEKSDHPTLLSMACCLPDEPVRLPTTVATQPCGLKCTLVGDVDPFRPLPPLPTASPLQLPSFLDLSASSSTPTSALPTQRSTLSAPTALLFCTPTEPPSRKQFKRKTQKEVAAGPHWIPAFHHPNSPYVPWTLPVRQRILPPPSPLSSSPDESSPYSRSGAVAPEPWTSHSFSDAPKILRKGKVSNTWKNFKNSIRKGVTKVVAHLGRAKKVSKEPLHSQNIPRSSVGNNITGTNDAATCSEQLIPIDNPCPRTSLTSFSSSDSVILATWLAERCTAAPEVANSVSGGVSIEAYEFMGSWLDVRHKDDGWLCGHQGCNLHLPDGSPNAMCGHIPVFRAAMPFDSLDLHRTVTQPVTSTLFLSTESPVVPPRFCSLPRLPSQSFDMTALCRTGSSHGRADAGRRLLSKKSWEVSMPGGWTLC